ncbi:MAG: Transketolase, C-terminal section [uncultured Acidimicrobiales bacterium]|uniref:Transketolase, C-terminal section n=1 Tax=uncultured Acidimicrobiales bacterium TaxID=310071 RepID=A0A6J4HT67_9ACTN|nr:MAG: Transketolase, C-terminal section [uncultured Acidimicrobiales bacterium]
MRGAILRTLIDLANADPRVVLLTGDLGFLVVEAFARAFPDRFWNVGVAEQDMIGIATGMAEAGFLPFTYSIATFSTLRPYEFVRNGPVHHRLPVRILGVGGGFEYGSAGPTHHGLEDVAVMRALPGLTVVAPADHEQAAAALLGTWDLPGPVYLRLGKDDHSVVAGLDGRFALGRAERVRTGTEGTVLVALGPIAREAVAAAELLSLRGLDCSVTVVACVSPAPVEDLLDAFRDAHTVVTVEAHSIVGGLGSLVSEVVAEHGLGCRVVRCGVRSGPDGVGGSESFLNVRHGLDRAGIARTVEGAAAERPAMGSPRGEGVVRSW